MKIDKSKKKINIWIKAAILLFWLLVWQIAAYVVDNRILLAGPVDVLLRLKEDLATADFYRSVAGSIGRIMAGFFMGFVAGVCFGSLAYRFQAVKWLLEPVVAAMKSIPVAAFVVLVLIWAGSKNLAIPISFLVVFPYIYINTWTGLGQTDTDMLEMARSFDMRTLNKVLHIYRPALMPYLSSAARVTTGMAFKSGIAAEVIGIPDFSIGEALYMSKIYLDTTGVLSWTVVVIAVSFVCEKLVLALIGAIGRARLTVLCGRKRETNSKELTFTPLQRVYENGVVVQTPKLALQEHDRVGIMGESGCGKTTWLKLLLQESIVNAACVFQEDRLCMDYSAVDNVKMVCEKEMAGQIREALKKLLPAEALERPVKELSGGMKRRVAVARACLAGGNLLLMDEPFTGLDKESRERTVDFILATQGERSLLFTTHQQEDLELFGAKCVLFTKNN